MHKGRLGRCSDRADRGLRDEIIMEAHVRGIRGSGENGGGCGD